MDELQKITFDTDDGPKEFYILDETRITETDYILVTNTNDPLAEEIEVLILKDVSTNDDIESVYEIVDDADEARAVAELFEDSIGDVEIV